MLKTLATKTIKTIYLQGLFKRNGKKHIPYYQFKCPVLIQTLIYFVIARAFLYTCVLTVSWKIKTLIVLKCNFLLFLCFTFPKRVDASCVGEERFVFLCSDQREVTNGHEEIVRWDDTAEPLYNVKSLGFVLWLFQEEPVDNRWKIPFLFETHGNDPSAGKGNFRIETVSSIECIKAGVIQLLYLSFLLQL